jgi:hypothetical protein
MREALGQPL